MANSAPVVIASNQSAVPISGTVTANAGTNLNTSALALDATLTGGTAQSKLTDGTRVVNVLAATSVSNTTSTQGAALVAGAYAEQISLSAGSLNADLVASTDVSNYKWFSIHITGVYSGTLTFQASNDNTNFLGTAAQLTSSTGSVVISTTSTNVIYYGPIDSKYLRIRMTAYTSGTANGTLELYATPPPQLYATSISQQSGTWTVQPGNTANTTAWKVDGSAVTQPVSGTVTASNTAGNVASGATDSGNPVKIGGVYNSTLPTLTTGQRGDMQLNAKGMPRNSLYFDDGTAVNQSGGNLMVNVGNFAIGTFGNSDANSAGTTSALAFSEALLFNGATWDRQRANYDTTTGDTGTKTATFAGATQTNYNARGACITFILGTVSGTTPTMSCQLQWSPDAGTTWLSIGSALANLIATSNTGVIIAYPTNSTVAGATPGALTTGATQSLLLNMALPRTWRINYTIGGTTPSFALTSVQVNYIL